MKKSQILYLNLLDETSEIKEFMKRTPQYHTFLTFSEFNIRCMDIMLNNEIIPRNKFFEKIPELKDECSHCWKFYLNPRNKSIKKYDIIYGKKFENAFIRFLNKLSILSKKADEEYAILPDNLILNKEDEILAYYEVKYHNAPFVRKYKFSPGRECYEGSLTLDFIKVKKQIEEINKITKAPVFYLHWVDFPCIKGVFYMTLEETQNILELGIDYKRKKREGNYIKTKKGEKKVGYQSKFYPSILKMKNLEDFVKTFK